MTYDLRRLRLHGIIERIEGTHRYRVTSEGLRVAVFLSRTWSRLLRPALSLAAPVAPNGRLQSAFARLEAEIAAFTKQQRCAA